LALAQAVLKTWFETMNATTPSITALACTAQTQRARVRFRVGNVFQPPAPELMELLFGDRLLEGAVVARSRGDDGDFVVVQVEGLAPLLVVSANNLIEEG
jgi:hypothetical protein